MNNKRRLSPIILVILIAMMLSVVPMFTFGASAEADDVTVKFYADDTVDYYQSMTVTTGDTIKLPTLPTENIPEGWTALGWVEDEVNGDEEPASIMAPGSDYTVNKNTNLYVLFSYTKAAGTAGPAGWYKTDLTDILATDVVVITMAKGGYCLCFDKC